MGTAGAHGGTSTIRGTTSAHRGTGTITGSTGAHGGTSTRAPVPSRAPPVLAVAPVPGHQYHYGHHQCSQWHQYRGTTRAHQCPVPGTGPRDGLAVPRRAFFWLVSLLLSSLIWFIAVKASDPRDEALQRGLLIFGVMFSVLLQEAFRFLYYKLLRKAIEGLVALSEDGCSPISIQQMAYVAGVGFGLMSGAFSMINLLADALGPGTVGIHGDSQLYFLTSAFMTMVLIFLHTFWGILFFHGCENRRWWEIAAVVVMHLAVSGSVSGWEQSSVLPPGMAGGVLVPASCGGAAWGTTSTVGVWGIATSPPLGCALHEPGPGAGFPLPRSTESPNGRGGEGLLVVICSSRD
uniref:Gamma-secretase subunit APH-1 n=1 Tax=Anser brachyrhynchus TaxID=132585 RepID=A0A8B9CIU1_9AVES